MAKTVVGLFDRMLKAEDVIQQLSSAGIERNQISLVAAEPQGIHAGHEHEARGTLSGAGTGVAIGGITGLVFGLGALAIPGVGPIVAAGPITSALSSAGIGAVAGGLLGALTGMDVPEQDAAYYAEGVRRGGALVTVHADNNEVARRAEDILKRAGAEDVRERVEEFRSGNWPGFRGQNPPPESQQVQHSTQPDRPQTTGSGNRSFEDGLEFNRPRSSFEDFSRDFRGDFSTRFPSSGATFEQYSPAYRYGHALASDARYQAREWQQIEDEARQHWEERNPGTWDEIKHAVRYAWDRVRSHAHV